MTDPTDDTPPRPPGAIDPARLDHGGCWAQSSPEAPAAQAPGSGRKHEQPKLLPQHQKLIDASEILPEVASERGYRSVKAKAELKRLGFSDRQCRVPALLVPVRGVTGDIVGYQSRPDEPRIANGKAIKYETPKGSRMVLDVPPGARQWLGDPTRPLIITEGVRKADAAVSKGLCAIALLGVWNWRGTNEQGGKVALPEWENVALNGRQVYIVFDSDVMAKDSVHLALVRLKAFLESRHARVRVVYLPSAEGGSKVGLDDYLASGHSVDSLLTLATDQLREPEGGFDPASPYEETSDGRIIWNKPEGREGGTVPVELANFTAEITSSVTEDDGVETRLLYGIEARVQGKTMSLSVPAEAFPSLNWTNQLGPKAIVAAGMGKKDHLRVAIQELSEEPEERRVFRHLGWTQRGTEWIYLHAAGAIGADGVVLDVEVSLAPPLDRFALPPPPEGEERAAAVRESMALLDGLAPDQVMFPMFSMLWRAVIGGAGISVHVAGQTGAGKTELVALGQRHFGAGMDAEHLPGSWSSTANSLEELAFLTKDAVLVVDDFKPGGSSHDVQRLHQAADRLIRAQGNRSGRGRMRADGSLRPPHPPRGILLSTGEDVPAGKSLGARMLVLELGEGQVDLARLSSRQAAGAEYSKTTAAFIRWVAPRLPQLQERIRKDGPLERDRLLPRLSHGRTATIGAELLVALRIFLGFAVEVGAIDAEHGQRLLERGERAILETLEAQAQHQSAADPVSAFLGLVAGALQSRAAHLADLRDGGVPMSEEQEDDETARLTGWRLAVSQGDQGKRTEWRPGGQLIGWVDSERGDAYLIPSAAYRAVQEMARESPTRITLTERMLLRSLDERGLLASKDEKRHTKKVRAVGKLRNAIHLRLESLFGESGTSGTSGTPADHAAAEAEVFPIPVPDSGGRREESGTGIGNEVLSSALLNGSVPDVPDSLDLRAEPERDARAAMPESEGKLPRKAAKHQPRLFEDAPVLNDPEGC